VALQTAVQGRPAQVRNRLLEGVEAVVEGQEGLLTEQDDGRFLGGREDRRGGFGAAHGLFRARALAPFGHRFGVDAEALG